MIDLHSHILPGLDDGARTLADSVDIAWAALKDGITADAGTPHVRDDWPTGAGDDGTAGPELRPSSRRPESRWRCGPGGEIALDWAVKLPAEELRRFGLGGSRYLLVETPYHAGWPLQLPDVLLSLRDRGFAPVLAHPERNVGCRPGRAARAAGRGRASSSRSPPRRSTDGSADGPPSAAIG
jgi:protein-tyrosine phosphatase